MACRKIVLLPALLTLLFHLSINAQTTNVLPRSTPEAEGISSKGILDFVEAAGKSEHELHSFMMLRHGKVVAEGWWAPYRPDLRHTMYSVSKSFTATAVGFAVSENRLSVEDKVISFFPDELPATVSPYLAELRIKDLLSMSAGQEPDPTGPTITKDSNWVKAFFSIPILHRPGTKFLYNSLCTYMLSAIVQKVTGEKLIDYLTPRLFVPLGITGMDWEVDPMGINTGGWGLRVKTEDMAKFGQLFLQKGNWQGKQVLPAAWVEAASTLKIVQHPDLPQVQKDASDWEQGYCYQMWRSRNNSYRGDGAFGQFIIVMPDQDAVIVITSETSDMQAEFNLVWKYLFPAIQKEKLPADKNTTATLKQKLAALALPLQTKKTTPPLVRSVSGKAFSMSPNALYVRNMAFQFKDDVCNVAVQIDTDTFKLAFGAGKWVFGETKKPGPSLVAGAKAHFAGLPASKVAGSYAWTDDHTLELTLRYIESPHTETFICHFDNNTVSIDRKISFNKNNIETIKGIVSQFPQKPIRLIVRGDDMGFSHSGNEALIKSYKEGIESSIEVIVPSPWFPEAVRLLELNPGIDVGVHLAITSEWDNVKWRPLTDCASIRDKDGYFYPMVFANKNYPGQSVTENNWKIADIEKEFRAQIEMALKKIPRISHVSAHMGCTNISDEVKAMTKRLAKEYNIDIDPEDYDAQWMGYDGPKTTAKEKIQSFMKALKMLEPGKTYMFVDHPGLDDAELRAIHHIGYEQVAADRQGVTELFTDERVRKFMLQNGIQLIGYKDLPATIGAKRR